MAITAVIPVLVAVAEYTLSACAGILIGIGLMDEDDDTAVDKVKPRTDDDIDSDIDEGKSRAKKRLDKIAASGVLTQAKVKCNRCPAEIGVPYEENTDTEKNNILYQAKITGNTFGPGWVQVWLFATVSFDGFQRASCLLQEAKGNYDRFFISDTQIVKWWSGSTGMIAQAIVQNAVVVATPPNELNWYFMLPMSYSFYSRLFISMGLSMRVFYVPY